MSENAQTSTKKTYHHGDLRQQLIDQAARILREEGEDALSMRKLAAQLGVSRTAPYHHFEDKQALLCAIAEEGFRRFEEAGEVKLPYADIEEYLSHHIRNYVFFAVESSEYYDLMFGGQIWKDGNLTPSLKELSYRVFRSYAERMAEMTEGRLPEGVTPLRFSQVTWSTMHGLSRLMVDGIYVEREAIEGMCDATVKILLQNLK